jgi:hypothetical protein
VVVVVVVIMDGDDDEGSTRIRIFIRRRWIPTHYYIYITTITVTT